MDIYVRRPRLCSVALAAVKHIPILGNGIYSNGTAALVVRAVKYDI